MEKTKLFASGLKVVSREPSGLSRAMQFLVIAANGGKTTPYQDLTVRLHRNGIDKIICIGVKALYRGSRPG